MKVKEHLEILGCQVKDRVTGLKGVATSVSFDLYGCIQVIVNPGLVDGKLSEIHWFDKNRLEVISRKKAMQPPNYDFGYQAEGRQGAAEKPRMEKP